jgi:hypothetical protein
MIKKRRLKQLAWREYLPMGGLIALWAVIVAAIGHADAARLLAAVLLIRSCQLLTRLATTVALRQRMKAPKPVRRQSRRFAFSLQAGSLVTALLLVAALVEAMQAIGQQQIAAYLPYVALGMPARYLRLADIKTGSPYFRLALSGGGLAMALLGWAAGWHAIGMAFAFGAREWIAYAVLRWWPRPPLEPKRQLSEPIRFAEIAQNSAVFGRRLLTYRVTKSLLTVFGPVGNLAARTGRGLNWHLKIEPYLPHHLGGFILFALTAFTAALFFAVRSGEPAAMILAGGLCQIGSAAANVTFFWRWLPPKGEDLREDDFDDE